MRRAALAGMALALGGLAGCGGGGDEAAVELVELETRPVVEILRFAGDIEALRKTPVVSPFDSTLLERIPHGTPVAPGQVVGRVDAVPHERELEVLEAELEEARGNLRLARFEQEDEEARLATEIRKAERTLARAEIALEALTRGRDVVTMTRLAGGIEANIRTLARLRADLAVQRPHLAKGFVSEQEIRDLESRIEQLDLSVKSDRLRLEVLEAGPAPERVADAELAVEVARAKLEKTRTGRQGRLAVRAARVQRAESQISELEEQIAERREKIAACAMTAPTSGTFLVNDDSMMGTKIEVGGRAFAQVPIGYVAEGGACELVFNVAETHQRHLRVGREIRFTPVSDRRSTFPAEIREVSRVARFDANDPVGVRWLEARARVLAPVEELGPVKPGLNAEIEIRDDGGGAEVRALPGRALAGSGVLLADGSFRPVRLGRVGLDWVEVLEGLLPGERVRLPGAATRGAREATVTRGHLVETYEEGGELVAESQEILYNNWSNAWRTKITWLIEEGKEVAAGEVCVKLDPGDLESEVESAREELEVARAALEKARAQGEADRAAKREEEAVLEKKLVYQRRTLALLEAGSAPEEKARLAANLEALRVDEAKLAEKLALTRKMEEKGFSGAREVAETEEKYLKAKADVRVAALELELARQGATTRELALARMDVEDADADLAAVRAETTRLAEKHAIQVAAAEANVRAKERALARKELLVEGMTLEASRPGTVVYQNHRDDKGERVPFEEGSFARRGEGVVAVADLSRARVEGLVSEEVAWRVREGQPARFWLPSFPEERFDARVKGLGQQPEKIPDTHDEQGLRVDLAVEQKSKRLQPGVQVRFEIELARHEDALLVPLAAVRSRDGQDLVVMADGAVRAVEVLGRDQTHAALAAGVAPGEVVRVP